MKVQLLTTFCILMSLSGLAQDSVGTHQKKIEGYKQWTKYSTSLRLGIGLQKSFYSEIGVSRHKYIYNDLGFASSAYYTAFEWTPAFSANNNSSIYGLKAGYEINARVLALGLETKYQTNFHNTDIVITPKIGLGFFGIVNLFYGYNISTFGSPFPKIGHAQFSFICNFSRYFSLKIRKEKIEPY